MDALIAPAASFFLIFILFNLVVALFVVSKRKLKSQNLFTTSSESKDLERAALQTPPGPTPVPVLGNLHQLAKYEENPYAGFTELSKSYGSVFKLQMGAYPCIIVSELDDIMEVLIKKGQHFDGRPNFMRWNAYFDGDRQLCKYLYFSFIKLPKLSYFDMILKYKNTFHFLLKSFFLFSLQHLPFVIGQTFRKPEEMS